MDRKALFQGARNLIRAEEIALRAGVACRLKTIVGPPQSPCGMKLVFAPQAEALLRGLWQEAGIEFKIDDDEI